MPPRARRERLPGAGVERQARRAGRRPDRFRPARPRDRDHDRRQVEQPGERRLGRGGAELVREFGQRAAATEAAGAARPSERGVGDHRDSELGAPLDDPAADGAIVVRRRARSARR